MHKNLNYTSSSGKFSYWGARRGAQAKCDGTNIKEAWNVQFLGFKGTKCREKF